MPRPSRRCRRQAAITTAARYLVTGSARTDTGEVRAFSFFVKVIHAYQRSPLRFTVPEHLPTEAAASSLGTPRQALYRSDLGIGCQAASRSCAP